MTDDTAQPEIIDIEADDIIEQKVGETATVAPLKRATKRSLIGASALAIVLAGVGGGWVYRDILANYFPNDQVQTMATRVETLETNAKAMSNKLDAVVGVTDEIKSQLGAAQAAAEEAKKTAGGLKSDFTTTKLSIIVAQSAIAKANTALDELRSKIDNGVSSTVEPNTSGLKARVDSLEKDVANLKQSAGATTTDNALLSQSLADLKAKIAAGTSFKDEFGRIQGLVPAAEGLDVLGANAELGIPNAQILALELKTIAAALPEIEPSKTNEDVSWWGSTTTMLSQLVTIKSAGTPDWRGLAAQTISFAEQRDLAKSVSTLERIEGALPVELQKWHDRAAARVAIEAALEKTSSAVLRQIAAKG
jgi:hypothetical protein